MMDADEVEARLIEAVRVFERMERTGPGWASDGPWRLMRMLRSERYSPVDDAEAAAWGVAEAIRSPRPDREMVARAEEAVSWLGLVNAADRPLVLAGVRALALGQTRVPWTRLLVRPDLWRDPAARGVATARGLALRYQRALRALAGRVGRAAVVGGV